MKTVLILFLASALISGGIGEIPGKISIYFLSEEGR
jgi:hypothetical protein